MSPRRRQMLWVSVAGIGILFNLGIHVVWAGWIVMLAGVVRMI